MKRLFQLVVGALALVGGWYAVQQANEHGLTNISLPNLTGMGSLVSSSGPCPTM